MSIPQGWVANSRRLREHQIQTPALQHGSRLGGLTWPRSPSQCLAGAAGPARCLARALACTEPGTLSQSHLVSFACPPAPGAACLCSQLSCSRTPVPTLQASLCLPRPPQPGNVPALAPCSNPAGLIQSGDPNLSTQGTKTKVRKSPKDTLLEVSASIHRREEPGAPS